MKLRKNFPEFSKRYFLSEIFFDLKTMKSGAERNSNGNVPVVEQTKPEIPKKPFPSFSSFFFGLGRSKLKPKDSPVADQDSSPTKVISLEK